MCSYEVFVLSNCTHLPEGNTVDREGVLIDSSSGHSHSEDILFCWDIVIRTYPIKIVQVTMTTNKNYGNFNTQLK